MSALETLLRQPWVDAVGWTLVHSLWQLAAVAALLAIVRVALRNRSANARYLAGCTALVLMLLLPGVTFWIAAGAGSAASIGHGEAAGYDTAQEPPVSPVAARSPTIPHEGEVPLIPVPAAPALSEAPARVSQPAVPWQQRLRSAVRPGLPTLAACWLVGVVVLSLRLLGGWFGVHRLRRAGTAAVAGRWERALGKLRQRLGIQQTLELLESALVEVPTVVGYLRPIILMPAGALTGLAPEQIEALVAHELAHVRRHDYLVNLFQRLVETVLFHHPAVWWVSRQVRCEREHCCDDLAVTACGDRTSYAQALATMEGLRRALPQPALAADGGSLLRRIQRIVGRPADKLNRRNAWVAGAFLVLALLSSTLGLYAASYGGRVGAPSEAPPAQRDGADETSAATSAERSPAKPAGLSQDEWIDRLKALQGHKAAAFRVGPELAGLDPDFAATAVEAAWPQLEDFQVKRGLLKAFHFKKHPRVLKVLHLGVTDSNAEVQETALDYLFDYAKRKFSGNTEAYRDWYQRFGRRPLDEIAQAARLEMRPEVEKKLRELAAAFKAGDLRRVQELGQELARHGDPIVIPTLIGVIDADNSYETVYGIGYFALGKMTGVLYSTFHDGAWWRRWWEKNKSQYPDEVQKTPIPDLPKTASGKAHTPFPDELDTLEGKIRWLQKLLAEGKTRELGFLARDIAQHDDPSAIPTLIGAIDADNSYETVYGIGHFSLGKMTGVRYSPYHDGAWWRRWWEQNQSKYPPKVQDTPIPDFPKTAHGRSHTPFPENLDTLKGQIAWLVRVFETGGSRMDIWNVAQEIGKWKDASAIPTMIGLIDAENTYETVYGIGYFGLGPITGVSYSEKHDGPWWRAWWEENKSQYPENVQKLEIPDYHELVASWRKKAEASQRQAALADVADVPAQDLTIDGNDKMRYFLIGAAENAEPPQDGYKLVVVMPGGGGGEEFHPFVRRLYKHAMGKGFLVAQPVAFKWHLLQMVVWPTRVNRAWGQKFATEDFVEAVVEDVRKRHPIDPRCIFTLTWSSSGPAAYAISLQEKTAVRGSYVAMSVYRHEWLPPLDRAKGHQYWLDHSPDDKICPFAQAKQAEKELTEAGATVRLVTYQGGHGWHGDLYGRVRRGIAWLVEQATTGQAPSPASARQP